MSNALGISPAVMINRMVDRAATPEGAQLAKVAELRMSLETAIAEQQSRAEAANPGADVAAPVVDSGAAVDRLI